MKLFFIFLVSSLLTVSINAEDSLTVSTSLGRIQGSLLTTSFGKTIYSFRGIPYAEAPIGDLRFEPPVPIKSYNGTFDATKEGPACFYLLPSLVTSEDCLRINVYTTNILKTSQENKKAVIVFLHPGAFHSFSGQSLYTGPEYILDHDIVLVSMNYRLGSFGFLSTGDKEAPGNNGMKDQIAALRWVKQNIAAFSGDPENVTIMGSSAGSISSILHLTSPMAKGLFHKVIAMSGAIGGNLGIEHNQRNLAEKQATFVGCPINSTKEMMVCLKKIPAQAIVMTFSKFLDTGTTWEKAKGLWRGQNFEYGDDIIKEEFDYGPILIWKPVIEPDFGQERYLTDDPVEILQNGNFSNIPMIMGVSELEFAFSAYNVIADEQNRKQMNEEWETIAPIAFIYERNTSRSKAISKRLKDYYLKSEDIKNDNNSLMALLNLYADAVVGFPSHRCANLLVNSNVNLYFYKFGYSGQYSHFYIPSENFGSMETLGAAHGDELIYLFYISISFPQFYVEHPDYITVKRMTKMWTDFAIFGNPTPEKSSLLNNVTWQSYKHDKAYMDIGSELQIKNCLFCDRYAVWDEIFPVPQR